MKGDFFLDEDFELVMKNGDFELSDHTTQDVNLLLQCAEGHLRNHLTYGINVDYYLNSNEGLSLQRKIIDQTGKINVDIAELDIDLSNNIVNISTEKVRRN